MLMNTIPGYYEQEPENNKIPDAKSEHTIFLLRPFKVKAAEANATECIR